MKFLVKLRDYLFPSDPFCKFDKSMKKYFWIFFAVSAIGRSLSLFFSFCMQISANYQEKGNFVLALVFLCLYLVFRDTIEDSYTFLRDAVQKIYQESCDRMSSSRVISILDTCRDKVYVNLEGSNVKESMGNNKLMNTVKNFLDARINAVFSTIANGFDIILIFISIFGIWKTAHLTTIQVPIFVCILTLIVVIYSILSIMQIKYRKENYKRIRKLRDKKDSILNSILNNSPISEKQSLFRINRFISLLKCIFHEDRTFSNKVNGFYILKSACKSIGCFTLIIFSIHSNGGLSNVNSVLFIQLIAFVTLFDSLVRQINSLCRNALNYADNITRLDEYAEDFYKILEVHNQNIALKVLNVEQIEISKDATFTYPVTSDVSTPFSISILSKILMKKGNVVAIFGKTGNGKSTLIKILTARLKWASDNSVTYYPFLNSQTTIPSSLVVSRDSKLGVESLFSEITCTDENSVLSENEKARLIRILKGVCIYDELYEKNPNVLQQLKSSTFAEYSSGQQARLVIANLLYNVVDADASLIAFDEITSSLDDATTVKVMRFIINELGKDRILLFVSHQMIIKQFANVVLHLEKGNVSKVQ